ncbi:helix-turn-helix domain-containing protein [Pseudazoarcus pumilus]|nr:helix-turn-helix transcriptional regulator [Pseudazoarcus pumilus]
MKHPTRSADLAPPDGLFALKMAIIISLKSIKAKIVFMKKVESKLLNDKQLAQTRELGESLHRLRIARRIKQSEAAVRAGMSRPTVRKIEQGDPGRTLGQLIRYLGVIAPGMTLQQLLQGKDPSVIFLEESERRRRVRDLTEAEKAALDF